MEAGMRGSHDGSVADMGWGGHMSVTGQWGGPVELLDASREPWSFGVSAWGIKEEGIVGTLEDWKLMRWGRMKGLDFREGDTRVWGSCEQYVLRRFSRTRMNSGWFPILLSGASCCWRCRQKGIFAWGIVKTFIHTTHACVHTQSPEAAHVHVLLH